MSFLEIALAGCLDWVGLLGLSVGGAAALKLATENSRVGAVMCYGTLPSYMVPFAGERVLNVAEQHWERSRQGLSFDQYFSQYTPIDCFDFADKVQVPVFLSGGTADAAYFRWEEQLSLADAMRRAPSVDIHAFKDWHHSVDIGSPGFDTACMMIANWFRVIWERPRGAKSKLS